MDSIWNLVAYSADHIAQRGTMTFQGYRDAEPAVKHIESRSFAVQGATFESIFSSGGDVQAKCFAYAKEFLDPTGNARLETF